MFDAHRHDDCSTFDGFGRPQELAKIAASLGHSALGITNHGNTTSLVRHYFACRDEKIKPIMGVEGYFLPKHKEKERGYHLCLFAKNLQGYKNLNTIQFEGEKRKYFNPIWDFDLLEKYSDGIICTSGCISSYLSKAIAADQIEKAEKYLRKTLDIFGRENFYIEIQPYRLSEEGLQEGVNEIAMKLGRKYNIKRILTSDSHFGKKDDFDTYLKMHEIAKHDTKDIVATYQERYIPSEDELMNRYCNMHDNDFTIASRMLDNLKDFESKVEGDILSQLSTEIPKYQPKHFKNESSLWHLSRWVEVGLKRIGKKNDAKYLLRAEDELKVIKELGFEDYFLIVADYTDWARQNNIAIGPGRGSGCNCLVNYTLGITNVDPILFDLDFERFLRVDKKKLPDIDLDFETGQRDRVIEYIVNKYENKAAQICSYGMYRIDNLLNDLAKVCGIDPETDSEDLVSIKKTVASFEEDDLVDVKALGQSNDATKWNKKYDGIIKHFCKLYQRVRYVGTHASGVAITESDILQFATKRIEPKAGKVFTAYDLQDMEEIGAIKFDILGLTTLSCINELQGMTGKSYSEEWLNDDAVLKEFSQGNTDGVFQFEQKSVQELLRNVEVSSIDDIIAVSAMNRPAPLQLGLPDQYATNKRNGIIGSADSPYAKFLQKTYGCIIYQEQVQAIATQIGGLSWPEADMILKMAHGGKASAVKNYYAYHDEYLAKFLKGCKKHGIKKDEAKTLFENFFNYSFNKGHSTAYSLISLIEMYYKVYYPTKFWYTKLKYTGKLDIAKYEKFKRNAVVSGAVLFLPHVNYTASTSLRKVEGEQVIQEGTLSIKGIGEKAASFIENERKENGVFINYDDFYDRCQNRAVTTKTIDLLRENGCIEFDRKKYIDRTTKYNATLYGKGIS